MKKYLCVFIGTMIFACGCIGPLADINLPEIPTLHEAKTYFAGDIFADAYYDQTGGVDIALDPAVVVSTASPEIYRGTDEQCDTAPMIQKGYLLLGYSYFKADDVDINSAILQAQKVKAEMVLLYSKRATAVAGLPLFPFAITVEKAAGATCSFPVPTYGGRTTYIPQRLSPRDCLATFWIKRTPLKFGVYVKALPAEKQPDTVGPNGVLVTAVVEGSPAFNAGIKKGDVIKQIGQTRITGIDGFSSIIAASAGNQVPVIVYRDGNLLEKNVAIEEKRVIEYPTQ